MSLGAVYSDREKSLHLILYPVLGLSNSWIETRADSEGQRVLNFETKARDWEKTFQGWSQPPSQTEIEK